MSNLWELRVWLSVDDRTIKSSTLKLKEEFKKTWNTIEKSIWSWSSKWLKNIKKETEKVVKTIWWLNRKLKSLNDELDDTKIWSKRFKQLQKEIKKTEKQLSKTWTKASKLWWIFEWLWWTIVWAFSIYAIWNFITSIAKLWAEVEQAKISFETLLGSEEKALQMLRDIDELASQTPFNKLWLTKSVQQLIWFWFEWEKALATIKVLWDSISAVWRWQADLNWVILALWQIEAKWKLSTEEVLQMAERWLPIFKVLEEQLWLTKKQLWDLWNQWIDSSTAINAILTWLNEKFAWSMEKQAKTLTWMWSNLVDNVQIAWSKMWLNIASSLKWIIGSINNFLQNNMSSIIDFWSDLATNIIWVAKSIAELFITTFEIINEAFWILTWENKKQVKDNFKLFKYLSMAISNGFQVIFMLVNTALRTVFWTIKSVWTALWWFIWHSVNFVSWLVKTMANNVISWINWIISWINKVSKFLWWSTLIKPLEKFSVRAEKIALQQWKVWDKTKNAFDFEWIAKSNQKIFWKMVDNVNNYENEINWVWKSNTNVFDKIDLKINELWNSFEKVWWKAKAMWKKWSWANDEIKDSIKELEKEYKNYNDKIKQAEKLNESLARNTIKYNTEIEDSLRKINKELENSKKKYEENIKLIKQQKYEQLDNQNQNTQEKISKRIIEIQEEKTEIQTKIDNEETTPEEKIKLQNNLNELVKEEIQAQKIVDQKILERIQNYEKATEIWKILLDQEKEKQKITSEAKQKEIEAEKELQIEKEALDRKQRYYEFFADKKRITQKEIDQIQKDERFLKLQEEEQNLILKLAREKQELTRQKDEAIFLQAEINDKTRELSNTTTQILKENITTLSNDYKKLISQINSAISAQRKLNAIKSSNSNWFADWWYTWDWAKHEVAWVVHKWEYVVNQEMIQKMPNILPQLESLRQWKSTTNNDYSKKVDVWNINLKNQIDLELFFDKLKFRM